MPISTEPPWDQVLCSESIDWLVFNANFSSISAISWHVQNRQMLGLYMLNEKRFPKFI